MSIFNGASPDIMMTMAQIGAALGGVPKHVQIDPSMAPPMVMGPPLYGSPETVLGRIKDIHDVLGMGRLEVSLGTVNPLPHEAMLSSLKLIGEEIVPELHAWLPKLDDDGSDVMTDTAVRAPGAAFVEHFVEAAGFTVRYLEAGDGPAVLYLPGAGGPVMTFALDTLAERFRVIVLEYPGWGAQPNDVADFDGLADQVAEIATALGLERFHLIGTSFGGACALHFVAPPRRQGRVAGARRLPARSAKRRCTRRRCAPEEFVRAFRSHPERLPHMSPPDPEFMARVWPTVERLMGDGADNGFSARLAELPTRTLILFGRDDGIINPINGRVLRRSLRNSSLQYVFDAAHDIQSDRPEAFADVVGDFLERGMKFLINDQDGLINP